MQTLLPNQSGYLRRIHECIERLSPAAAAAVEAATETIAVKRGSLLLRPRQVCRASYFIQSGIVRKYYKTGEKEITTDFFFAGDVAVAFSSYCLQTPASEFIQALTDSTVEATAHAGFQQAKREHPELCGLDLLMTEHYAAFLEERLTQLQTMDATQRYLHLLHHGPQVVQQIQLTHIASYLHISLETLSRIRARLQG